MSQKALFICDPIEHFNIQKDTTYQMMSVAAAKGIQLFVANSSDLSVIDTQAHGLVSELTLHDGESWYQKTDSKQRFLGDFDFIFMRKDPPFDMNYIYSTYILELAEKQGAKVINRAQSLRDANEKMFINEFPDAITRMIVTSQQAQILEFLQQEKDIIVKPLDGMGGSSICRLTQDDHNVSVIIEMLTQHGAQPIMVQRYLPEIIDGDKRILIVNGKPLNHCLARIPAKGETRANLAAGGHGEVRELTARDHELAAMIGPELVNRGLYFVGFDVIGDYVSEINVTSPTCAQEIAKETDENASEILFDSLI